MKLLEGKKGIISGALNEKSIAWQVALAAVEHGAQIVLTNAPASVRFGDTRKLAEQLDCPVFAADATSITDLEAMTDSAMEHFGGKFDFVLHSIGMSVNIRKKRQYQDIDYGFMDKTLDISALSLHKMLQTMYHKDALNDWGSVVALTYIAADRVIDGYNDMADAKALLQSITRNFGLIYGRGHHVRINTVSQSPTATTAGQGIEGMQSMLEWADRVSPLGNASARDCANYVVTLFSDLTRMVTMQNLYHDGGYSATGLNAAAFDMP